jgi:serine/threonine protein kinase
MQKDRYEILGPLGFGATSRVDKARDKIIGRTVAIKTLVHSFGAAPQQKQFLREAQIVGQLSHPAIVNLFDVGVEETGIAYLVMEYVNGRTLQQVLSESPIPWPRACSWAADLATALGRAHHAGIIHGDVKPANIMITEEGEVKLSDFGIARFATQVSGSGRIMGTPAYLSPEQIMGEPHSTRSDLFSLGIVLYEMLTGVPAFDGSSVAAVCAQILTTDPVPPSRRNPALPPGLDHIVMRCLAKKAEDRYPSGDALAASLYPLGRHAPVSVPTTNISWWSRPLQARDIWAFASVILLAGVSVLPLATHPCADHLLWCPQSAGRSARLRRRGVSPGCFGCYCPAQPPPSAEENPHRATLREPSPSQSRIGPRHSATNPAGSFGCDCAFSGLTDACRLACSRGYRTCCPADQD